MEQRAEPPSWLPDGGRSRTSAAADLRNPEADEAATGTPDGDTGYSFSGDTSYPDSQDTTFGQAGAPVGSYSYDSGAAGDAKSAVPPYPAALTEPAGSSAKSSSATSTSSSPAKSGSATSSPGGPGQGSSSLSSGAAADSPAAAAKQDVRDRTSTFSAVTRGRYKAGLRCRRGCRGWRHGGQSAEAWPKPGTPARRADLVISRLEPWSVMKFSFLMSLVAWVVLFVAVAFLYFVLSSLGVFTSIEHTLGSVTSSSGSSSGSSISHWFSASRILGYTMLLGAVNIVLITALSTVGSMIYNLVTHLGGGIEVTLRETD